MVSSPAWNADGLTAVQVRTLSSPPRCQVLRSSLGQATGSGTGEGLPAPYPVGNRMHHVPEDEAVKSPPSQGGGSGFKTRPGYSWRSKAIGAPPGCGPGAKRVRVPSIAPSHSIDMAVVIVTEERPGCPVHGQSFVAWDAGNNRWQCWHSTSATSDPAQCCQRKLYQPREGLSIGELRRLEPGPA